MASRVLAEAIRLTSRWSCRFFADFPQVVKEPDAMALQFRARTDA